MNEKIYNILASFLGDSKTGYDNEQEQYQFNCPHCAEEKGVLCDNKYNLEVNLKIGKFHCWSCGDSFNTKGNISKLIKLYGNNSLYNEYKKEIYSLKESKLYNIPLLSNSNIGDDILVSLPKTYNKINIETLKNTKLIDFLNERKISQDIIDEYNIGYTSYNEDDSVLRNRLIIPSYNEYGELNFWTGRDFTKNKKRIKYFNSKVDKKDIIFLESKINFDANIILVEGAIDALYVPNAIALLGKSLKNDSFLYKTLYKKSNANIIICLDSDTDISETKRIYNILNIGRLKNKIFYIRLGEKNLPFKDFGELYENENKNGIKKALRSAKQFSEIDLLI